MRVTRGVAAACVVTMSVLLARGVARADVDDATLGATMATSLDARYEAALSSSDALLAASARAEIRGRFALLHDHLEVGGWMSAEHDWIGLRDLGAQLHRTGVAELGLTAAAALRPAEALALSLRGLVGLAPRVLGLDALDVYGRAALTAIRADAEVAPPQSPFAMHAAVWLGWTTYTTTRVGALLLGAFLEVSARVARRLTLLVRATSRGNSVFGAEHELAAGVALQDVPLRIELFTVLDVGAAVPWIGLRVASALTARPPRASSAIRPH